ncbi:nucleosome assembly protein NAP [Nitzschia inconspicua]|uniref:Nucleosome assembly protein NAP n=1 Tax=Nitzschia inconspicua TaxID=303405 RepID=A0A9K3PWD8_9STRA|nr:nucleosome assembly protein NAP [Nitzschia inconspicua]KAG7362262.1 nucleosome assembly protein NAP [Nitzschia inconspicua]
MTEAPQDSSSSSQTPPSACYKAAATASSNTSSASNGPVGGVPTSLEERILTEMDAAKDMKISELKMKLMAKGILTSTFCEKAEFVRAYAELVVKEQDKTSAGLTPDSTNNMSSWANKVSIDGDDSDDDDDHVDNDDDEPVSLPKSVIRRVDKLKELNDQRELLMKEYLVERAKLESKYNELSQPLYQQRKEIVIGTVNDNEESSDNDDEKEETIQGIPQFWVVALSQMPVTAELIAEPDVDCLGYLQDITCSDYENGEGFTLTFHFAPNDYFENSTLTKTYDVPNLLTADEPILKNVEGCEIHWKSGKSLMFTDVSKQQRGKGKNAGQVRTVTRKEKSESFFHFFTPPKMPSIEAMNEEEAVKIEAAFEEDYDVAQAIRSHIVPKAVMWFAGDAMEKEMEAAMQGMEWPPGAGTAAPPPSGDEKPECQQS